MGMPALGGRRLKQDAVGQAIQSVHHQVSAGEDTWQALGGGKPLRQSTRTAGLTRRTRSASCQCLALTQIGFGAQHLPVQVVVLKRVAIHHDQAAQAPMRAKPSTT